MINKNQHMGFREQFEQVSRKFKQFSASSILNDLVQLMFVMAATDYFHSEMFKSSSGGRIYVAPQLLQTLSEIRKDYPEGYPDAINELTRLYIIEVFVTEPFTDVIGSIYQELSGGKKLDQYFTPPSVATLMAKIVRPGSSSHIASSKPIEVRDDCCGAGALLLAQLRQIHEDGGNVALARTKIFANDLDVNMCKFTVVQIMMSSALKQLPLRRLRITNWNALNDCSEKDSGAILIYDWSVRSSDRKIRSRWDA